MASVACMRIVWSVLGVASVAVLLSGCLPPQPVLAPTPEPTSTPIFASDEEALAAAEAAYGAYSAASDAIAADGGSGAERIAPFVTADWLPKEIEAFKTFGDSGNKQIGTTVLSKFVLQRLDDAGGSVSATVYLCADFSTTRFVNTSGVDVTPPGRVDVVALAADLELADAKTMHFLISKTEPWSGASSC